MTDLYGRETSWELVSTNHNTILLKGGPYPPQYLDKKSSCVDYGKHELRMHDTHSDSICCKYGTGYYKLSVDGKVAKVGGAFGQSDVICFNVSKM